MSAVIYYRNVCLTQNLSQKRESLRGKFEPNFFVSMKLRARQLVVPGHLNLCEYSFTGVFAQTDTINSISSSDDIVRPLDQINYPFNLRNSVIWMAVLAILTKGEQGYISFSIANAELFLVSSNCFLAGYDRDFSDEEKNLMSVIIQPKCSVLDTHTWEK